MGTNEITLVRDSAGTQRLLHRSHGPPHYALTMLGGPATMLEDARHAEPCDDPLGAEAVAILDPTQQRAAIMASLVTDDDPDELIEAERALVTGVWAAFGWELAHLPRLAARWPDRWPKPKRRRGLDAAQARGLYERLGDWSPLVPGAPSADDVAPLSEAVSRARLGIVDVDGLPVLDRGGRAGTPRELVFAVGCAVASKRLDLPSFALSGTAKAWVNPPASSKPRWTDLVTAPRTLAAALVAPSGMTESELMEELEEATRIGLENRGVEVGDDPFAALKAASPEIQTKVVAKTRGLFKDAGIV